jgi:HAD superfamily phosphoserine phosphatase-like hydrolase
VRAADLVAFDVDGTLVRGPRERTVWEVLNERFTGCADHDRVRYGLYREGKLSYAEWVGLDVASWRDAGARREDLIAAFSVLRLVDGTREALAELADAGCRLFVVSGTLDLMLETLYPDHRFEEIYANRVGFDGEGRITHWQATPFDMEGKAELLRALALREDIPLARCAFVGDSSNDVWIAQTAGLSLAFNPKCPELEGAVDAVVRSEDLRDILPHLLPARR